MKYDTLLKKFIGDEKKMSKKTGLGSGLDSLFVDNIPELSDASGDDKTISALRLSMIEPKKSQPRKDFNRESLSELADSIAKHGLIQPIIVRRLMNGYYQIIAGERRWRAAKMAGLDEVPVVVKDVDDLTAAEMTMVENLQREDLNPVEEAYGYKYLSDEYALTQEEIAKKVAKSRSVVANSMRLLTLPEEVIKYVEEGKLTAGHARALLSLDSPELQILFASRIIKNDLTVRDVEKFAKEKRNPASEKQSFSPSDEDLYFDALQKKVSGSFGTTVKINQNRNKGKQNGTVEISFKNDDELEGLLKLLCGEEIFDDM